MQLTQRQADLVAAAMRVLDREGLHGCTMRVLAAEAGLSPMAAYKHFENQRELHLLLWRESMRSFGAHVVEYARLTDDEPLASFLAICRGFMEYGLLRPHRFELVFAHPLVHEVRKEAWLHEDRFSMYELGSRYIALAQEQGAVRVDMERDALLLFAVSHLTGMTASLISERANNLSRLPTDRLMDSSLTLLRDALTSGTRR
jgi:AcrR family transcriptional regulator